MSRGHLRNREAVDRVKGWWIVSSPKYHVVSLACDRCIRMTRLMSSGKYIQESNMIGLHILRYNVWTDNQFIDRSDVFLWAKHIMRGISECVSAFRLSITISIIQGETTNLSRTTYFFQYLMPFSDLIL